MAKLSTKTRKKLPAADFALKGKKFPIEDKAHAVAAERLVGRSEKAGNISAAQAQEVKAKAAKKLGDKKPAAKGVAKMNVGGWDHHESMRGLQHDSPLHTSKDR